MKNNKEISSNFFQTKYHYPPFCCHPKQACWPCKNAETLPGIRFPIQIYQKKPLSVS